MTAPPGFRLAVDFVSGNEATTLLEAIGSIGFSRVEMRGGVAKRRVVHYGWTYGYDARRTEPGVPIPDFLLPLRARCGALTAIDAERFAEVLITEYPAGAGIGWHRDAPMFGPAVVGLSLGSACRFRFRRDHAGRFESATFVLDPRSAYILSGAARTLWQHSILATQGVRYSITFRTIRGKQ